MALKFTKSIFQLRKDVHYNDCFYSSVKPKLRWIVFFVFFCHFHAFRKAYISTSFLNRNMLKTYLVFKIWANPGLFFVYFCSFLIPISITISIQIEKAYMVCLRFEPGPHDGRRRRNHGAMAGPKYVFCLVKCIFH